MPGLTQAPYVTRPARVHPAAEHSSAYRQGRLTGDVFSDENAKAWRVATGTIIAIWLLGVARLFIADVWDETNGLVVFGSANGQSALQIVRVILKTPLPFWRPVPTILAALAIHWIPDPELAWRFLRVVNVALVLAALWLLLKTLEAWDGRSERRNTFFALAYLFSGGAIIVAAWYANIFDASVMLMVAWGLLFLARGRFWIAGLLFGVAFFFKETAAMTLPLLLLLMAIGRIRFNEAVKVAIPTVAIGIFYFLLRNLVVPFGSAGDTHQFRLAMLVPTAAGLIESYWRETLWGSPTILGYVVFLFSLTAMRGWRARLAYAAYVLFAMVIYLEMFAIYQGNTLIHYLMFVPRLYFIPVSLTLLVFALDRRWWAVAVLAAPLLAGAIGTYVRYERFQRSYRNLYRYARTAPKPVRIDYAMKPLHDPARSLEIGGFPDAPLRIDPVNGLLVKR